ncbi:hypothetical protein BWR18_01630 [Tateyamaria omphalii]|uniref:Uncharacterized protein n=2 Tax=Tateyamaria omphalii TaxID=299262 RepID=A0A1P8MR41_9RHOB|nr:hypothetical protein BWR18_01630 [Tateyamaria omphalii]
MEQNARAKGLIQRADKKTQRQSNMAQILNGQTNRWRMAAIRASLRQAFGTCAPEHSGPERLGILLNALRKTSGAATEK